MTKRKRAPGAFAGLRSGLTDTNAFAVIYRTCEKQKRSGTRGGFFVVLIMLGLIAFRLYMQRSERKERSPFQFPSGGVTL